jgi:Ran GTPase-activating protein (RanGAP) involved in mRNA processing and transport
VLANLRELGLGGNKLRDEGMRHLSEALASRDGVLANLRELNLGGNSFGAESMRHLSGT